MTTITTDARGRAHLGAKEQTYKVTDLGEGALLLEPATVYTEAELAVLTDPELLRQVRANADSSELGRPLNRRRG